LPDSCPGGEFWDPNLSGKVVPNRPGSTHGLANLIGQTSDTSVSSPPPNQIVYRRRIGRGGRIIFDRHMQKSSWSSHHTSGEYDKWKYDDLDGESTHHHIHELEETEKFTMYRAFHLAPSTEQECRLLMNKPHFSEQINISPRTQLQRAVVQLAMDEKAAMASPAPRKKAAATGGRVATAASVVKKIKPPEIPLNPREAAVKNLLLASQKQAQLEADDAALNNHNMRPGMGGG
jgi:hypothetical protein